MQQTFFGTRLPIIQAPMAGVQDSGLAIAVASAGGLGSVPAAMLSAEQLEQQLQVLQAHSDKSFNINFFCHTPATFSASRQARWCEQLQPYFDEWGISPDELPDGAGLKPFSHTMADVLAAFKPAVVSFHFGLPEAELLARVKQHSIVWSSATTVEEALWLEAHGADAIIAQGFEAGGHRGMFLTTDISTQLGTLSLLPQIIKRVQIPVIAAGGIADAKTVMAALSLGASAVQVGTAYLLCDETGTSRLHRQALQSDCAQHTAITNVFTGRPARSIVNRIIREQGPISSHTPDFPMASGAIALLRKKAEAQDCSDFTSLWCGQNASGCAPIPAAEMTNRLAAMLVKK